LALSEVHDFGKGKGGGGRGQCRVEG